MYHDWNNSNTLNFECAAAVDAGCKKLRLNCALTTSITLKTMLILCKITPIISSIEMMLVL